jgi:hypothetical protein
MKIYNRPFENCKVVCGDNPCHSKEMLLCPNVYLGKDEPKIKREIG